MPTEQIQHFIDGRRMNGRSGCFLMPTCADVAGGA